MRIKNWYKNFYKTYFKNDDLIVDPYQIINTTGKEIDYDKLINQFGC